MSKVAVIVLPACNVPANASLTLKPEPDVTVPVVVEPVPSLVAEAKPTFVDAVSLIVVKSVTVADVLLTVAIVRGEPVTVLLSNAVPPKVSVTLSSLTAVLGTLNLILSILRVSLEPVLVYALTVLSLA